MSESEPWDDIATGAALVLLAGVVGRMGWRMIHAAGERIAIGQLLSGAGAGELWRNVLTTGGPRPRELERAPRPAPVRVTLDETGTGTVRLPLDAP